jgi:hypothetical protein
MFLLVGALALLGGCGASSAPRVKRLWANSYAWGTLGARSFDARDLCNGTGPKRMEVVATPTTVLLSVVTVGMYTPQEVQVQCQ